MIEFKKLSAVDAVETVSETAHVLIEEDGVIKRAPKEEVGGKKEEYDIDIVAFYDNGNNTWDYQVNKMCTYDELVAKLSNGVYPNMKIFVEGDFTSEEWGFTYTKDFITAFFAYPDSGEICIEGDNYKTYFGFAIGIISSGETFIEFYYD